MRLTSQVPAIMKLNELRPGMDKIEIIVKLVDRKGPREVETNYGVTHIIVDGEVEDESDKMALTVWNEKTQEINKVEIGEQIRLLNAFVTSFKGVLSLNIGRDTLFKELQAR